MGMHSLEHELLQQVKSYERQVFRNPIQCPFQICPRCHAPDPKFKPHAIISRIYQVIVEDEVHTIDSVIIRMKCLICCLTFRLYPDFAVPYKRYVLPNIMDLSERYLEDDGQTYRKSVTEDNAEFYHQQESGKKISVLAHSTLYRWITSLSELVQTMACALSLINKKDPATGIFRILAALKIPRKKYRSEARKTKLWECRALLRVEKEFVRLFSWGTKNISVFTDFATLLNWR